MSNVKPKITTVKHSPLQFSGLTLFIDYIVTVLLHGPMVEITTVRARVWLEYGTTVARANTRPEYEPGYQLGLVTSSCASGVDNDSARRGSRIGIIFC
jgi:hypothetical protein